MVDAYSGRTVNKNYINFQFKGGAADDVRRNRRSRGIAKVLQSLGFIVDTKADVVRARFQKHPAEAIEEALDHLGRMLQFTRQMDMLMQKRSQRDDAGRMLSECRLPPVPEEIDDRKRNGLIYRILILTENLWLIYGSIDLGCPVEYVANLF